MPDEVYERPRHAWHDSARSCGSRVVREEGERRCSAEGRMSVERRVGGRQFLSPYVARPLQQPHLRLETCACPY